jgi:hypothetical protein
MYFGSIRMSGDGLSVQKKSRPEPQNVGLKFMANGTLILMQFLSVHFRVGLVVTGRIMFS